LVDVSGIAHGYISPTNLLSLGQPIY